MTLLAGHLVRVIWRDITTLIWLPRPSIHRSRPGPGEAVTSVDVQVGELIRVGDRFGQWDEWPGVGDALVRPVGVVEDLVLA
jgi:hypothetical protein